MSVRVLLQPAYVLHRRAYRETSWLLEIFSRDHGRVGLIARGARQARPRSQNSLEPVRELLLSWTLRGELGTLNQAEPASAGAGLGGTELVSALYLNELLLRLITRHDPHPALYGYYRDTLQGLVTSADPEALLRRFEYLLLQELGYGLNLLRDSTGQQIRPGISYDYCLGEGAMPLQSPASRANGVAISGDSLLALNESRLDSAQSKREAKYLLRAALSPHLGEKPLKTRELARSLHRLGKPAHTAVGS